MRSGPTNSCSCPGRTRFSSAGHVPCARGRSSGRLSRGRAVSLIAESDLATLRDKVDILELIGEHVVLKRVGGSYRGLCPFHAEKSPSFYVHPDKGFFRCFGCGAGGNA